MVSFHHDSQRLAVGSSDNVIVIYDLKTASRWHVLEGHKQALSAVAFSENGKVRRTEKRKKKKKKRSE
jgi:WD40 repeat protein